MFRDVQYEPVGPAHVEAAAELVILAYREEREAVAFLPPEDEFTREITGAISGLFSGGTGIAAMRNGKLKGFLAGFPVDELFGSQPGIYCPVYGHGAHENGRGRIYQDLYRKAAGMWVGKGHTSHAITLFAHDRETIDTWFWLGFGLRCIDAIRVAAPVQGGDASVQVRKVDAGDVFRLEAIHREHNLYYRKSPVFMPRPEEDAVQDLTAWLGWPGHHMWMATSGGRPIGYIRVQPGAETFVSGHPGVMNVTGAYVLEEARRSGVGASLLGAVQQWLEENGYPLCGVDCESINTTGCSFWMKHFTPYTYSLVRRIDERVLQFGPAGL